MSEQERIAIKEILNEIYVAGNELQTYKNLLNKLAELREPDLKFVDMRQRATDGMRARCTADPFFGINKNHYPNANDL